MFGLPSPGSCDEVGLVGHASRTSAADTDEDAFVQPAEVGGGGLHPRRGTEGVQVGVDEKSATCGRQNNAFAYQSPSTSVDAMSSAPGRLARCASCLLSPSTST